MALALGAAGQAPADSAAPPVAVPVAIPTDTALPALAAGTVIRIRVEVALSSRTAKRGDRFPIALAEDVRRGEAIILPAGLRGEGEVVHAAGKGFGGRAGELILAARWLEVDGKRLPLRGFRLGVAGANNTAEAMVATMIFTPAGLFVTGTSAEVRAGQLAEAKLAAPFPVPFPAPSTINP